MSQNKTAKLESLLFSEGSEMKKKDLMKILDLDPNQFELVVKNLLVSMAGRGVVLLETDSTLALRTSPEQAQFLKEIHTESLKGDIGRAGLETLTILLYRGPSTRAEIDYIRGVNSSFIVRNLMVRGLIERVKSKDDNRFLYKVTVDTLSILGISRIEDLPNYEKIKMEIEKLEKNEEIKQDEQNAE